MPDRLSVQDIADMKSLKWVSFIPPTAKVRSTMNASFNADGQMVASNTPVPSAGAFQAIFSSWPASMSRWMASREGSASISR